MTEVKKGVKHSESKPPVGKLFKQFPNALKAVAMCSLFGHLKYEEYDEDWLNYQRVEGQDYVDAMARHLLGGDDCDEQSKLPHKFHVAWNALADLEKHITDAIGEDIFNHSHKYTVEAWGNQFRKTDFIDEYNKKGIRLKSKNSKETQNNKTMNSKINFSYELSDIEQKAFKEWKDKIIQIYGDEGMLIYHISTNGEDSSLAITSDHSGETMYFENDNVITVGK